MRGAGTSSPRHSCRRRWPSWSAAPCASNLGGSCRPSDSLGTSGLACLLPINPFSGLWHSVAAWGWGRRWRRCPVQVGSVASGVSCLLAVEYLGPPLGPVLATSTVLACVPDTGSPPGDPGRTPPAFWGRRNKIHNGYLPSLCSGGRASEVTVLATDPLTPGMALPSSSLQLGGSQGPLAQGCLDPTSASPVLDLGPSVGLCYLVWSLTGCVCEDPLSRQGHSLRLHMDVGFGGLCSTQDTPTALPSQAFAPRLGGAACRVVGFPFWAPGPRGGDGTVLLRVSLGREEGRGRPA